MPLPAFGIMTPYPGTEVARLAALGEAGYKLVTSDWDEFNKQVGGALEFANLTRSQIEKLQVMAYVKVYLYNHRYLDFIKFLWHYKTGAWSVFTRMLGIRKKKSKYFEVKQKDDHNEFDEEGIKEIASATKDWQRLQIVELARAKRVNSELIKIRSKTSKTLGKKF